MLIFNKNIGLDFKVVKIQQHILWLILTSKLVIHKTKLSATACGILVFYPGIEPVPPAVEVWSLNHWTIREISMNRFFYLLFASIKLRVKNQDANIN